jgi:hypothetical protein
VQTEARCECGCGRVIYRNDSDPFFKGPSCQQLWLASLGVPEGTRSAWRAQQRHMTEMTWRVEWADVWEYVVVSDHRILDIANNMLAARKLLRFTEDQMEDAYRLVVHMLSTAVEHGDWLLWLMPAWVLHSQSMPAVLDQSTAAWPPPFPGSSAATLDVAVPG